MHTAWGEKEGAPKHIWAIAQTPDGFLWLGVDNGITRFDGVTFEHYEPPSGPALRPGGVIALMALPNGDLWIGFVNGGVSLLRDGRAVNFAEPEEVVDAGVLSFAQDGMGTVWAATSGGLAKFEGDHWIAVGKDWNFPAGLVRSLFVDREGTLWVATETTIVSLPRGARTFQTTSMQVGTVSQITQARNGKLWMAETTRSVRPLPLGTNSLPSDPTEVRFGSEGILFARDGDLWVTTLGDGLRHVPAPEDLRGKPDKSDPSIDSFTTKDGLTDDVNLSIFQDRDGNIWVGTDGGLDRFRKSSFTPIHLQGTTLNNQLVPADQGDIWLLSTAGLARVHGSTASLLPNSVALLDGWEAVYREPAGAIWWVTSKRLLRSEKDRFTPFPLPDGIADSYVGQREQWAAISEDRDGTLWMAIGKEGFFYRKGDTWKRFDTPPELKASNPLTAYTDDGGRIWFGYDGGTLVYLEDGKIRTLATGRESPLGAVCVIRGHHRQIWIGGSYGLTFSDGQRLLPVGPSDARNFGIIWGMEETPDGSLWLRESRGVIHISPEELHKFLKDPTHRVHYALLDASDGLPGKFEISLRQQGEVLDSEGRLWFLATKGFASLDPASLAANDPPPPAAVIRAVIADGKRFPSDDSLVLPPLTGRLEIAYAGLNISTPERVGLRYELEGVDKGWQDAGTSREASYTSLSPGKHRFRLNARNVGGEWNAEDTVLEFNVAPAWFQSIWFRAFCTAAILLIIWAVYRMRVRQVANAMSVRFDERLSERTRIARDLHDTLLQTIQGTKLVADSALKNSSDPTRMHGALEQISTWMGQATEEGRAALNSLRASTTETNDLAAAFERAIEECRMNTPIETSFSVVGEFSEMHPILRDEVYRIGYEAIRNACVHSQATHLQVELTYAEDLILRVQDDGVGIDPAIVDEGKEGHFGLRGMRERARHIMAKLTVETPAAGGTEIKLVVPGSIIYRRTIFGRPKSRALKSILKRMGPKSDSTDF